MIKKEINSIEEQTIISEDSKNKNIGFKSNKRERKKIICYIVLYLFKSVNSIS